MLTTSTIPDRFFPLPEGCVLLGQGGHIPNASRRLSGYVINLNIENDNYDEWRWVNSFNAEDDDNLCYAVPGDHPLVDANHELVESLNPSVVFPWMDELVDPEEPVTPEPPSFVPARELPANLPPIPEGCVLLGFGGTHLNDTDRGDRGYYLNATRTNLAWSIQSNWGLADTSGVFAYPSDSAVARANPEVVAYYQQLLSTQPVVNTAAPAFRPLPPNLPPCPEGLVIVGYGDSYHPVSPPGPHAYAHGGPVRYAWSSVYHGRAGLSTGPNYDHELHAYAPDSATALAMPEAVAFYNPSMPEAVAFYNPSMTTPTTIPLEPWMRPLPEGYVYLGRGGTFQAPPMRDQTLMLVTEPNTTWRFSTNGGYRGNDVNAYYAAPVRHAPAPRATTSPSAPITTPITTRLVPPPHLDPLPEGAVYLGIGGSFERGGLTRFEGWYNPYGGNAWDHQTGLAGIDPNRHFAVAPDSPLLALNPTILSPAPAPEPEPAPQTYGKRQWLITLNGAPVASLSELENLCSPLISKPENLTPLTDCLWRALEYDDPEERLGDWATKEPVLLMVDFLPDKSEAGTLMPAVIESSKSIGEIITTAAAGVLLRGGLSNHFHYTEEGRLVINPASPPSIDQGCEILRRTLEVRETGQKLDNYSAWTLGMLGDELERFFGDDFDPSLVMQATGRAYNTYITSLKVYRELWANRRNLSFTHHKEALYAKVAPEDTTFILDTADKLRLSVAQQRKLTSFVRLYGSASFADDPADDADALMERLEVKSVNKNYLFFLRSENKWFKYRGPFEHIPNGATTIINADTRAMLDAEGKPTEMSEWTPVGVEMPYVRGHAATLEAHRAEALPGDDEVEPSHGGNTDSRTSADEPLDIGQVLRDMEPVLTENFSALVARNINPLTGESLQVASTQEETEPPF